jgi:hypothetical protein
MNKKPDKPSKKDYVYFSACKEIRLKSDPAAKVLVSIIVDGYGREEK